MSEVAGSADGGADPSGGRAALNAALDRIEGVLGTVEGAVATLAMALILFGIVANVIVRYFALPLPNLGEISIVAMSPLTFVGAALCSVLHRHITIDVVDAIGSPVARRLVHLASAIAMTTFSAYLAFLAWDFFAYARSSGERLLDLGTPVTLPTGFFFAGALLMFVHAVFDVVRVAAGLPRSGAAG